MSFLKIWMTPVVLLALAGGVCGGPADPTTGTADINVAVWYKTIGDRKTVEIQIQTATYVVEQVPANFTTSCDPTRLFIACQDIGHGIIRVSPTGHTRNRVANISFEGKNVIIVVPVGSRIRWSVTDLDQ